MGRKFPEELKEKAVRLTRDHMMVETCSFWQAATVIGERLGVSPHTIRAWDAQRIQASNANGETAEDVSAELKRLRREVVELRRANELLKAASAFFARELDHPGL